MKDLFIPYEQALALKDLGFDEHCFAFYRRFNDYNFEIAKNPLSNCDLMDGLQGITAPLYQQAFKWFREKYGLKHDIDDDNIGTKFYYKIKSFTDKFDNYDDILLLIRKERDWTKIEFKTYEEAELECLNKLIEIVKNK